MKEKMVKRFFAPIWRCNEIESRLEECEKNGWRLDRIYGFRKFSFIRTSPKTVTYFFTCSLVNELGMITTEELLKKQYKANRINGNFIEGLKTSSVYRITQDVDLSQRKIYRNRYLSHLVLQYTIIGLFYLILSVAGLVLSCTLNGNSFWDTSHIFMFFMGIFGAVFSSYHLFGWLYLRKEYCEYL